ncbi:hypothetical protein [Citrobacter werkmanii]|uniref:hypothetical protein n=1 Tax=Citrobacter werkmanii TaxID=67827 RepID=UPI0037C5BF27
MTPMEMLDAIKKRFKPLLVQEDDVLEQMLIKTLTVYQDRAGFARRIRLTKGDGLVIPFPKDYLELVHVSDNRGCAVVADVFDQIELELFGTEMYPFTLTYWVNLRDYDLKRAEIPRQIIGYLEDYLYHLIDTMNTERLRRVSVAGKLDASTLPDEATMYQRKVELETAMSQNRAIFTGATFA